MDRQLRWKTNCCREHSHSRGREVPPGKSALHCSGAVRGRGGRSTKGVDHRVHRTATTEVKCVVPELYPHVRHRCVGLGSISLLRSPERPSTPHAGWKIGSVSHCCEGARARI